MTGLEVLSWLGLIHLVLYVAILRRDLGRLQSQVNRFLNSQNQINDALIDKSMAQTMREKGIPGTPKDMWKYAGLEMPGDKGGN